VLNFAYCFAFTLHQNQLSDCDSDRETPKTKNVPGRDSIRTAQPAIGVDVGAKRPDVQYADGLPNRRLVALGVVITFHEVVGRVGIHEIVDDWKAVER
jgi:hypothetical protein